MCRVPVVALLFAVQACGGDVSGGGADADVRGFEFPAGQFQFTTTAIDDGCLDGGLHPLYMPEGTGTPKEWDYPIHLYPTEELPKTYGIELREPFGEMTVQVERVSAGEERARGVQNTGVQLGEAQFGQCVADLDADVLITLRTRDRATGQGALMMSNARGDDRCPKDMPADCTVLLTLDILRIQGG